MFLTENKINKNEGIKRDIDKLGTIALVSTKLCIGLVMICSLGIDSINKREDLKFNLHSINKEQNIRNTNILLLKSNRYSKELNLALVVVKEIT